MPNYKYKAINQEGKTIDSVILAADQDDVIHQLKQLNMVPISVTKQESSQSLGKLKFKVKESTIILFTKQFYTLLKAGVPIVASLRAVREQTADPSFKKIIEIICQDIEQGSKLSDSFSQFPKVFPPIYINSLKIGEVSGTLEETLRYLHKYLDDDARMRSEVKKALRYPMFVLVGIIGAFIVFMTTVIPNFLPLFQSTGTELPLPTKIIVMMYEIMTNYGLVLVLVIIGLISGLIFYGKKPEGRLQLDTFVLSVPIVGPFIQKVNISHFAKLFYTMNRTGIAITKSFEIMQETMRNAVYNKELKIASDKIIKGEGIASSLKQSPYFTPLLVEMIAIGEKSGSLDDMLQSVTSFYDKEVEEMVSNMTSLIEPVVTVLLGGMILLLALAMFMPMWEMLNIL